MARDDETARYEQAAHLALDQLEWCVAYFRSIRKTRLSQQLARNRAAVIRRLREESDQAARQRPETREHRRAVTRG